MLEITELRKSFRQPGGEQAQILDVPKYQVKAGEQALLIGPSGGGKTTLLHIIAGITRPDAGQIKVDNVDIGKFSESGRDRLRARSIGYVFQTFNLLPAFSALENVILGMTFSGMKNVSRAAREMLQRGDPITDLVIEEAFPNEENYIAQLSYELDYDGLKIDDDEDVPSFSAEGVQCESACDEHGYHLLQCPRAAAIS